MCPFFYHLQNILCILLVFFIHFTRNIFYDFPLPSLSYTIIILQFWQGFLKSGLLSHKKRDQKTPFSNLQQWYFILHSSSAQQNVSKHFSSFDANYVTLQLDCIDCFISPTHILFRVDSRIFSELKLCLLGQVFIIIKTLLVVSPYNYF